MGAEDRSLKSNLSLNLKDLILDQSKIQKRNIPLEELVVVKIEERKFGPVWIKDLDELVFKFASQFKQAKIRTFGDKKWQNVFEFGHYNRRSEKPAKQVTPASKRPRTQLTNDKTYLVLGPTKSKAPMTGQDVLEKLDAGEILITDMISDDQGKTWRPLHQRDEFLFALRGQGKLPNRPDTGIFELSALEAKEAINRPIDSGDEKEAIAGLAYIGHLTKTNAQERDYSENVRQFVGPWYTQWKWRILGASLILGIFLVGLFWSSDKNTAIPFTSKPVSKPTSPKTPPRRVQPTPRSAVPAKPKAASRPRKVTPSPQVRALPAAKPRMVEQARPTRPESVPKRRPSYNRPKELQDDPLLRDEQDDYYYDDQDPVEQDPARRKLSKKTIDPPPSEPIQDDYPPDQGHPDDTSAPEADRQVEPLEPEYNEVDPQDEY